MEKLRKLIGLLQEIEAQDIGDWLTDGGDENTLITRDELYEAEEIIKRWQKRVEQERKKLEKNIPWWKRLFS